MTALMGRSERPVPRVQAVSSDILTVGLDDDVYHIPSNFLTLCSHQGMKIKCVSLSVRCMNYIYLFTRALQAKIG